MTTYNTFTFEGFLTKEQLDFIDQHGFIYFENPVPEVGSALTDKPRHPAIHNNRSGKRKLNRPFRKSISRAIDLRAGVTAE